MVACALALIAPLTAGADAEAQATLAPGLLAAAHAEPDSAFSIIVQGEAGTESVAAEVEEAAEAAVDESFVTVPGVSATLTGDEIVALAASSEPLVITLDTALTAADAPANIELPTIVGSAEAGNALTTQAGAWSGTPPLTHSYQWQRCAASGDDCHEIAASTSAAYTLDAADVGSVVRAVITASGSEGSATATSAPTAVVTAAAAPVVRPGNTAEPHVSGLEEPGQVLTTTPGAWTGGGELAYSYQWERCHMRSRDEVVAADAPLGFWRLSEHGGQTAADASGQGLNGSYIGALTYGIGGVTGDSNTGVDLEGTGGVEVPGLAAAAFSGGFSLEAWVDTTGAQADRVVMARRLPSEGGIMLWIDEAGHYSLVAGRDETTYLRTGVPPTGLWDHVVATWDRSTLRLYRNGVLIGSEAFSGVLGEPAVNLTLGGYSGSAAWLNADLDEVAVYSRALSDADVRGHYWGCRDVPAATQASYTATAHDLGFRLRTSVTATNAAGSSSSTSAVTATVSARPPTSTSRPTILGTVEEGQTVTAANGGWDGTPPFSFDYEWERCDVDGANCNDIYGARDAAYVVRASDVGRRIRVRVTADNLGGDRSAASYSSETVPAMPEAVPAFKQHWPYVAGVASLHAGPAGQAEPGTIAIVDSGIDASRADFGDRVIEQVTKTERVPNSPGDGYGHGTAVASVAAGQAEGYTGAAPGANLVSIDVLDDTGVGNVSDVIAAADWIYANRERLGIKVANFSLHGTTLASLVSDPLDRAVERLWQSGIVVVAAAGNYAVDGAESAVPFAPGNDPFVLTVGATDTRGSFTQRDDVAAPWSAWGYTRDGFAKPELVAPGRYIAAAVSADAKLARDRPDRVVEPGYLQLSGTSLAAPVVAGTAASMLGQNPSWTPDQVKGALMLTAKPLPQAAPRSVGVGAVSAADAAAAADPPNPNLALNEFLVDDPDGGPTRVFDAAAWTEVVETDVAWGSVAWGSVAWGSAAWSSVAWGSVAWGSVAWGSVAWGSVAWGSVAWGSVAWGSAANDDLRPGGVYWVRQN